MTAPRWAGLSHAEIVAMVAAGPGPSASAGAERAWRDAAAALTDVHRELAGQVRDLPGGWSGGTADGVTVAFGSLDGWVVSAAVDAGRTADALAAQAGLAADLRARMPAAAAPTPPETAPTGPALLDDWAAADLAAGNSAGRATELMVRYDDDTRVTGAPWTGWGASPVVTHEGTAPASPAVPAPSPGGPPPGPGGDADPAPDPAGGAATGTTVFAGIGFGGITAAVLTGNGRAGVPGARPIDVGGPSSGPAPTTDAPRTGTPGAPGTDTGPGTGDLPAGPASPARAGVPDGVGGAVPFGGGTAVTAAVLAGGALGGAGILIGATIRRERRARDGRGHAEDGTPPGHPPGDGPPSGAEHRPPSGDATTSGTRAPSGTPAADGGAPPTPGGPAPDGATGDTAPHGGPAPHTGPAPGATTSDRPSPDGTGGGAAPGVPDGPRSPVHHGVTTGDLAVPRPDGAAPHGAVTHARHAPPPTPAPGDPAVAPAGIPVGAVPAAPLPVAATVGSPADPRTPAWRLVADEHAAPDDPPEQPDARPDPGVLRPDARWRGRG
ncbi:hypothetical protein ACIGG9_20445 [Pseudonocardia alni]|uniref:hypothetical protein n=1 Tax=Pseudonocardia alni TaxID=33907 RepID=UPI0033C6D49F